MAYQFLHVRTYSIKTGGAGIAAEAGRKPDHCRHVDEPQPPVVLVGTTPDQAWAEIERRHAEAQVIVQTKAGPRPRRLRSDENVLLAAVASYPTPTAELDQQDPGFLDWQRRTLAQLEREHGPALSAVLHLDESHPHIHYLTAPDLEAGQRMADIHPGERAKRDAGGREGKKTAKDAAYKAAMRGYQDRYHQAVGIHHGMARLGPRRLRLTRDEWKARQAEAQRIASALDLGRRAQQRAQVVSRRAHRLLEAEKGLKAQETALQGRERAVAASEARSATIWGRLVSIVTLGRRGVDRRIREALEAEKARTELARRHLAEQARKAQASAAAMARQLDAERRRAELLGVELEAQRGTVAELEHQVDPQRRAIAALQAQLDQAARALEGGDLVALERVLSKRERDQAGERRQEQQPGRSGPDLDHSLDR